MQTYLAIGGWTEPMRVNLLSDDTLFDRVFHNSAVGMVITTIDEGRYVQVNDAFARLLGYEPSELIGQPSPLLGLDNEEERNLVLGVLKRAGRLGDVPLTLTTRDGGQRVAIGSIQLEEIQGQRYFLSMIQDTTAQQAAEAQLRADEERLRIIAEVATDAIWDRDMATDAVAWSAGLGALFGFVEEADRPHTWWYEHVHPADREAVNAGIEAALASSDSSWTAEYRFRRADGRYATVLDRGHIIRDADGRPSRFIGAMVDITAPLQVVEAATRATLAERQRLARDLHDSVTQLLYSASLMAETARRHVLAHEHQQSLEYITRLSDLTRQSLRQMRMLVHELGPATPPDRANLARAARHWQEAAESIARV